MSFLATRNDKRRAFGRFWMNRPARFGLFFVLVLIAIAIFGPLFVADPYKTSSAFRTPPSAAHWLGTDQIGRDQLARVIFGARTSLLVGTVATLSVTLLGGFLGVIAGWFGRVTDTAVMRSVDIILAFPYIMLALVITSVIGIGLKAVLVVSLIGGFGGISRLLRGEVLRVRSLEFIDAARTTGASTKRILVRHLLPNSIQPIAITASGAIADFIVGEAALSFLGRGIQEPTASWGLMIARSRSFFEEAPHLLFAPGLALISLSLALVFIGDGVRDALDPRVEQRFL
jgi:peptide/nickel transport system permease protein